MPRTIVRNSADAEQIDKAQQAEQQAGAALKRVLSTEDGRQFIYELLHDVCNITRPSHVPGDPTSTSFNEGARSVGLRLLADVMEHKQLYLMMLAEQLVDND